jgi:metal-responsive CopG/Arc/MetJ family transcriptional regulator
MAIINISISEELLEEVEKYRKVIKKNRSEFFKDAAELYFKKINSDIAYEKRLVALKELIQISEEIKKKGVFKGMDVIEEIRNMRKERTDELLKKLK